MIYMMQQIAPGPYKTAHYTFATALMGACMMSTGAISGYVQNAVGYQWFFIIVLLAAVPSLLVTHLGSVPSSRIPLARDKPDWRSTCRRSSNVISAKNPATPKGKP